MQTRSNRTRCRRTPSLGLHLGGVLLLGCLLVAPGCKTPPPIVVEPPYSHYHAPDFSWGEAGRVLILPLRNETSHPAAAEEVRRALAAELQQMGRFEMVLTPPDDQACLSREIRQNGRFNEAVMVDLARHHGADLIVLGGLTHYRPYQRPHLGLTLQVVHPLSGKVVASVDGLWDSTRHDIADRAVAFYSRPLTYKDHLAHHLLGAVDTSYADELVLDSPQLFQRFVCHEAALALVEPPMQPGLAPGSPSAPCDLP